jgi:AcrR family transcriptional regulator
MNRALPRNRARRGTARERIDRTAYALFSRRGIRAVGIDEVIERSGVAKATLYRHYPTKNRLALAFLRRREKLWTQSWLQASVERRGGTPAARLLAVFDVFDPWFRRARFEGCAFLNVLLESNPGERAMRSAALSHLATIRRFLERLAKEAGARDPENLAWQWHIIMKGSIVAAGEGDRNAARRARDIGRLLLAHEGLGVRPTTASRDRRKARS